jgi:hypothetical protein
MTTGFRLTLLCLVMLCLLLSLTQPAEFDHLLPIVGSGSWFAPHTESGTDAPTASVARSMQSSARAGPRQSLVFSGTLTVVNTGPPGWGRVGPPPLIAVLASCRCGVTPATPKSTPSGTIRRENTGSNHQFSKFGVSQQPLARSVTTTWYT